MAEARFAEERAANGYTRNKKSPYFQMGAIRSKKQGGAPLSVQEKQRGV